MSKQVACASRGVLFLLAGCGAASPAPATVDPRATPIAEQRQEGSAATVLEVTGDLLPPLTVGVTSFGATADATHAYVIGGYHGTPHEYVREDQSTSLARMPLDGSGPWEELAQLEHGVQGLALVAHEGRVCRFGGTQILNDADEPTEMRSLRDAACFDEESHAWTALPELPSGRSSHEAARIGDTVYLAGGWDLRGDSAHAEWASDLLALDLRSPGAWRSIPAPFQRRALGVAAAGQNVVVVGGLTPEREVSPRVDVFNTEQGTWSRGPDFPGAIESAAFGLAAVGVGGAVYASGREGVLYRWRLGDAAWAPVGTLAFGRFFHQLVPRGANEIVALGGISGMHTGGRTRIVEVLPLEPSDAPRVSTLRVLFPGASRNRQGALLMEDTLYLFGGNNSLGQHDFEPENFQAEGWQFFLPALSFIEGPAYPARRQTMQTVEIDGGGISIGGFGHDGTNAVTMPEAFVFSNGTWSERAGLPRARTQFNLVRHGGRLYVFGGLNYDPAREGEEAFDHPTDILSADEADAAAPFAPIEAILPAPRRHYGGAVLGDRYYIVGGMRGGFDIVDDCLSFDFTSQTFEEAPCPRRPRLGGQLVAIGDRLYLAGGSVQGADGIEVDRSVEVFDPATGRWEVLIEDVPSVTQHVRMMRHGQRLLMFSTHHETPELTLTWIAP